ncbi:IclR family transcriptional regulator [Fibrisoma montanum]|uniref:IclR family transcriptional regulator n=1 Tax=Fibrisoma montanum TaxID=2305895 RepID=A0A418MIL2_9BACT|nr:IclR family transcriptional regulator C-terminal domain-containing protein [Fibrisoma montanum]RIV27262.1 IclR family transcriptional regulator [Fibrisoma montanum]
MIQVVNRALDILEQIAADPEKPKSLSDIADPLGLNHGTCANILKTLVNRNYVEQIGTKKGYILGAKAYSLTGNEAYRKDLLDAARDEMDLVTRKVNENCLLATLKGNMRQVVLRTYAEQDLQVRTADEKHVYDSASGRLLVAMLPDADLDRFVRKYGLPSAEIWPEADTDDKFQTCISAIRSQGYALQVVPKRQIIGLAVAVYKHKNVVASLSIYLPEYRYTVADKTGLIQLLQKAAKHISARLA